MTRGRRLRCGSAETGTSGERACRGRPRRGGSAQRQEGGAAVRGSWRSAEGRGGRERVPLHAPPAGLAGFLILGTQFPRGSSGARGLARTQARIHTLQSARSSLLQPRPGKRSCCSFLEPRFEGGSRTIVPRREPGAHRPPWVSSPADCSPSSGKPVSLLVTGSGLVPPDPRERVGGCGCARPGETWSCDFRGCSLYWRRLAGAITTPVTYSTNLELQPPPPSQ